MPYEIACRCGRIIPVSDGMAGSSYDCECGEAVRIPSLGEMRSGPVEERGPSGETDCWASDDSPPSRQAAREILGPARVWLQSLSGPEAKRGRKAPVMIVLTPGTLWIQDGCRLRSIPLNDADVATEAGREALIVAPRGDIPGDKFRLDFSGERQRQSWYEGLVANESVTAVAPVEAPVDRLGPVLVRGAASVPHHDLGEVEFRHQPGDSADQGVQLRAGLRGADAVIDVVREKWPDLGAGAYRVTGRAIRAEAEDDRRALRRLWYTQEVSALVKRLLWLLVIECAILFAAGVFLVGRTTIMTATGQTFAEEASTTAMAMALLFGWPFLMVILLGALRSRELLVPAALSVLAVTTLRGLAAVGGHLAAVVSAGKPLAESKILMILDPIDWAFIVLGMTSFLRARRLARQSGRILGQDVRQASPTRRKVARGLLATTGVFAVACVAWVGIERHQESAFLLQPGVDPRREHAAILAYNEGIQHLQKGDQAAAELSLTTALGLWEELTRTPNPPPSYRANLALSLVNLGYLRSQQGRDEEAESYLSRSAELADQLVGDPGLDDETKQVLASSRATLTGFRNERAYKRLAQLDQEARDKYERAQVTEDKDPRGAERLYREAVGTWEEILPQATSNDYRKESLTRLATAYLQLAQVQSNLDHRADLGASLKKSVEYGEKAVGLNPSRPLPKHNLELARRALARLNEQSFQDEIENLSKAGKFPEVLAAFTRSIRELEAGLSAGKDPEDSARTLAARCDRLAWFLAHCPLKRIRDTKASLEHARRAAGLRPDVADYWFTLAMVQYRNGDWRDSLATLDAVKARQGELDASDWLLSAMNLHRLDRKKEAREAVDKALDWMRERNRKAENNPLLQMQNQMLWPSIESLLKETRELLEGAENAGPKAA